MTTGSVGGNNGGGEFLVKRFDTLEIGGKKIDIDTKKGKISIPGVGSYTVSYGGEPVANLKHLQETVMSFVKDLLGKIGHDLDPHNLHMEIDKEKIVYQPKGSADSKKEFVNLTRLFIDLHKLEKGEDIEDEDGDDFEDLENENKINKYPNFKNIDLDNLSSEEDEYEDEDSKSIDLNKKNTDENIDIRVTEGKDKRDK